MSQLILSAIGDLAENALLVTEPDLTIGPDDVLLSLEAAVINPVDFLYAAGWYGVPAEPGAVLGAEGVGRVVEAGANVDPGLVGRRVVLLPTFDQGAWAHQVVAPAHNVVPIGEEGDAEQLAQLTINPATALVLIRRYGAHLRPGDWIGQTLGNSGVGQYVIALAKRAGLRTLSVVRSEAAADLVRSIGGDLVVIAGDDLADRVRSALDGRPLELVLDGEGGSTVAALAQSLVSGGTVAAYSAITGAPQAIGIADLIFREVELKGWWLVNWLRNAPREEVEATYAELAGLVADGTLHSVVAARYHLTDYREAIAHAASANRGGKIVFTFDDSEV